MNDDLEFRIAKLSLAPDDILVVRFRAYLSTEAAKRVDALIRTVCGESCKHLILDGGVDLAVLTRAEIEARTC